MEFIIFMGGACFGLIVGGLFSKAHEDPFTAMTPNQAIEDLISKAEPQEPYLTTYDDDLKYVCPECLYGFSKDERPDYCPECGQRIKWEGRK